MRESDPKLEALFQQKVFNPEISRIFNPFSWADWAFMEGQAQGSLLLCYPERGFMRQWKHREVK